MSDSSTPGERLRRLMSSAPPVIAPGVSDGVTAALAGRAGFDCIYVSGAGTAAARGLPDMSVMSLTELTDAVRTLTAASGCDAIVDLDTGYGGAVTIRRAMRDLAGAGAAAVHLEDQDFPRRCGYLTTDAPVAPSEMVARLDAARAAGTDVMVIARTDALLTEGLDSAVDRARRYAEAGAEAVFVNGLRDLDELSRVLDEVGAPVVYNVSGSDRSPFLTRRQAAEMGVAVVIHPIQAARAAALAAARYLADLAGDRPPDPGGLMPFEQFMDLAGWGDASRFEASLAPGAEEAG